MLKIFDKQIQTEELPEGLSDSVRRSKLIRSTSPMHRWWAARTFALSRIATFLAVTDQQKPDEKLLTEMAQPTLNSQIQSEIKSQIRDAQWRWLWREQENADAKGPNREVPSRPDDPCILDPFAGSGSIPSEATRLGCRAHALDLNPLSFHILHASLVYPVLFGKSCEEFLGTSGDHHWGGLDVEVTHWANRVRAIAEERLSSLYPAFERDGKTIRPSGYLWVQTDDCLHCRSIYPVRQLLPVQRADDRLQLLSVDGDAANYKVELQSPRKVNAEELRRSSCPRCGGATDPRTYGAPILVAAILGSGARSKLEPVDGRTASGVAPWADVNAGRLSEFLGRPVGSRLQQQLPAEGYGSAIRRGAKAFKDLFTARQLLAGLEYFNAITDVEAEMRTVGITDERITAVRTYLAFLLGYLIERNSIGCAWRYSPFGRTASTFDRPALYVQPFFVEQVPHDLVSTWQNSIQPKIRYSATLQHPTDIKLGSATHLPYDDDCFDAIITDPPFYDRIPYADLSSFYWVWEKGLLDRPATGPVEQAESDAFGATSQTPSEFQSGFQHAMAESYRVLKQGRIFAMLLTSRTKEHFESYIATAQKSGFELLNVKSITEGGQISDATPSVTAIAYFRKPFRNARRPPLWADAEVTLRAVQQNKPVLYCGLADLLIRELDEGDLAEFIPANAKGTKPEIMMEVLADSDLRRLLLECFGRPGIRRIAAKIGVSGEKDTADNLVDKVLSHFGFTVPISHADMNPTAALDKLNKIHHRVSDIRGKSELRGAFLDAFTAVERMIKLAVFGWARVIFEANWRTVLEGILPPNHRGIERLTFGDIVALFKALPDAGAETVQQRGLLGKVGSAHVYRPKRFKERLDRIVARRNYVEHDRGGYWTNGTLAALAEDLEIATNDSLGLISDLVAERAVPRIARATRETRDEWNRITCTLLLDDGGEKEVSVSHPLALGMYYLYFGTATNPRSVDPIMVPVDEK